MADTLVRIRGGAAPAAVASVDSVTKFGTGRVVLVEMYVAGDIGFGLAASDDAIAVDKANTIVVGGNVLDDITLGGSAPLADFLDIVTIGGHLRGSVRVRNSFINDIVVVGDVETSIGGPVSVEARGGIGALQAASINADIVANYQNALGGNVSLIRTTSGDFVGSLAATSILSLNPNEGLDIAGDLDANTTIADGVYDPIQVGGEFAAGRTLNILGQLLDDSSNDGRIVLAAGGLKGQVIINGGNSGAGWLGNITVGATALSSGYAQLSSALGGGAAGRAPFELHDEDCDPANNSGNAVKIQSFVGGSTPITLRHYGPVSNDTAAKPVVIEWYNDIDPVNPVWQDVSMLFAVTESPGGRRRELLIGAAAGTTDLTFPSGEYRIRPIRDTGNADRLRCDDVTGRPVVADYDYRFTLFQDCNGNDRPDPEELEKGISPDCNNNGRPDECDIADGISEDVNPADGVPDECGTPPECTTDWDESGGVNSSDISAFLTSWLDSVNNNNLNADFNGDLAVNSTDISAFLTAWIADVNNGC